MGCYSNDRFVAKALHARQKHKDTFHHQRNVSKCFIPPKNDPCCFLNNTRSPHGLNSPLIMQCDRMLKCNYLDMALASQ